MKSAMYWALGVFIVGVVVIAALIALAELVNMPLRGRDRD